MCIRNITYAMIAMIVMIAMIMLLCSSVASGATYHVRTNGTAGNTCPPNTDTQPGSRNTITGGLTCLSPGDTLLVHAGNYDENGLKPPNGNSGAWVFIKAAPGETVTIRGPIGSIGENMINLDNGQSYQEWEGFILDGRATSETSGSQRGIVFYDPSHHIIFRNMEVKNIGQIGVTVQQPESRHFDAFVQFINVNVHHNGYWYPSPTPGDTVWHTGHGYYQTLSNVIIDGGSIHDNAGHGIQWYVIHSASGNIMRNVKVYRNGQGPASGPGVGVYNPNHEIYNNVIYDNPGGMTITSANNQVYNNTVWNNNQFYNLHFRNDSSGNNVQNNITQSMENEGSNSLSKNLCPTCDVTGNPQFHNAGAGDFHLNNTSAAINQGNSGGGIPTTDIEHQPRVGATDIGAYECQNLSAADCSGTPPQPPPIGEVARLECNGNFINAISGSPFTQSGGTVATGPALVGTGNSCVFDGIDNLLSGPNNESYRPDNFGFAAWYNSNTAPTQYCHLMRLGNTAVLGINNAGQAFCFINFGPTVDTVDSVLGSIRLLGCGYDAASGMLRLWVDNVNVDSESVGAGTTLNYAGSEVLQIGGDPVTNAFCNANLDNIRMNDLAWTPSGMLNIYNERTPSAGTASTHWRFYAADSAEGVTIAGHDIDAPSIVHARSAKLRQRYNVARAGTTTIEYYHTECRLNAGAFVQIDNSCLINSVCIANDTIMNMGDATSNLLPNDGNTFTPGIFTVDTINAGLTTTLTNGQVSEFEKSYAFHPALSDGDIIECRLRTSLGPLNSYPATLPKIIINAPPAGSQIGGTIRGGTTQ